MRKRHSRYKPRYRFDKRSRNKKISSGSFLTILVVSALVLFACTQIWQRVYILNLSTEVGTLKKENKTLQDLTKKSKVEINELCRHARIKELASEQFKLQQTASENLFTLVSEHKFADTDRFSDLWTSLKKVTDHLPVITETKAETKDMFDFDEK